MAHNDIFQEALSILKGETDLNNGSQTKNVVLAAMLSHLWSLIHDNKKSIEKIEKLVPYIKAMIWIMVAFATSVVALIFGIMVGKIELVFH